MKKIAVEFTFHTDLIEVPDHIVNDIKSIQNDFDQWLYDKTIDHGCWVMEHGNKIAVAFDTSDFVRYLNQYVLTKNIEKASIVQYGLTVPPTGIPSIWF